MLTSKYRLIALVSLVSSLVSASHGQTLISHFPFDTDASNASTAPGGTLSNGALIDSSTFRIGSGSAKFDGIDDLVQATTGAVPGANGGYYQGTVAFWFKGDDVSRFGDLRFLGQQNGDPATFGGDNRMSFEISTNAAGSIQAFIRTHDGTESNNRLKFRHQEPGNVFPTDWANGEWNHLAFTWATDSAGAVSDLVQIYINAEPVRTVITESSLESDPVKSPILDWEAPGMFIGARNNRIAQGGFADGHVKGWIDDLQIFDGPLDGAAIRQISGIPEPSSAALCIIGGIACLHRHRRRR